MARERVESQISGEFAMDTLQDVVVSRIYPDLYVQVPNQDRQEYGNWLSLRSEKFQEIIKGAGIVYLDVFKKAVQKIEETAKENRFRTRRMVTDLGVRIINKYLTSTD